MEVVYSFLKKKSSIFGARERACHKDGESEMICIPQRPQILLGLGSRKFRDTSSANHFKTLLLILLFPTKKKNERMKKDEELSCIAGNEEEKRMKWCCYSCTSCS